MPSFPCSNKGECQITMSWGEFQLERDRVEMQLKMISQTPSNRIQAAQSCPTFLWLPKKANEHFWTLWKTLGPAAPIDQSRTLKKMDDFESFSYCLSTTLAFSACLPLPSEANDSSWRWAAKNGSVRRKGLARKSLEGCKCRRAARLS